MPNLRSHHKRASITLLALNGFSLIAVGQTQPDAGSRKIQGLIAMLPKGSSHHSDVAYVPGTQPGTKPDSVQTLDLHVPPGKGPFPLVFWIHGGGWHGGGKLESGTNLALKFLPKGFALASINYRLTGDAPFPAQIEDCNSALAFLRQRADSYRIDPDRVGTLGHSAGAHLSALMACTGNAKRFSSDPTASIRVQAAVCWAIRPCSRSHGMGHGGLVSRPWSAGARRHRDSFTSGDRRRCVPGGRFVSTKNPISAQVIIALRWIGKRFVDDDVIARLRRNLSPSDRADLLADAGCAPAWIAEIFRHLAKDTTDA